MADVFLPLIQKFASLGLFNFLIFILAFSLIYALLKQRKILGENPLVNGIVSFSIAFFIFVYPVITGISLTTPLVTFFSQAFTFILLFFIGFLIASFFYPDLPKILESFFKSRNTFFAMIALSLTLFVTSGLVGVIYSSTPSQQKGPSPPVDVSLLIAGLIIAVVILLIAGSIGRGG